MTRASVRALASRYLAFVSHAFDRTSGRFRNFLSYARHWLEPCGSEDSHGRALWALGAVVGRAGDPGRHSLAGDLFHAALPAVTHVHEPARLGLRAARHRRVPARLPGRQHRRSAARRARRAAARPLPADEPAATGRGSRTRVTYCNARLSQALIVSGDRMDRERHDRRPACARSSGWCRCSRRRTRLLRRRSARTASIERGAPQAAFDQQPVEACAMVSACLDACRVTRRPIAGPSTRGARSTGSSARTTCSSWLYDPSTGGCRDGLHADRPNENQGAESTLSFLLALARACGPPTALDVHSAPLRGTSADIMKSTQHYEVLFHRHDGNPILTAADWPYPAHTVFNAGATRLRDGTTLLLCRVEDRRGHSHLCAARSANGVDGWIIDQRADALGRIRTDIPRSCGASKTRASPSSRSSGKYVVAYTAFSEAAPAWRWRSPRTFATSSARVSSCSPTTRTRRCCRAASTAASRCSIAR